MGYLEDFKKNLASKELFDDSTLWNFEVTPAFIDWFITCKHGLFLTSVEKEIPKYLTIKNHAAQNCFYNAQLISLNNNIQYSEGLMYGPVFKTCIHHGFNIKDDKVIDVTWIENSSNFANPPDKYFYYYGIPIDNDFIKKHINEQDLKYCHNPILLKYYLENKSK